MATLAELREIVRSILREPVAARWSNADLNRYINAAVLEIARTMERRKSDSIAVAAGTAIINLPDDCLVLDEVFWLETGEDEKRKLYPGLGTMPARTDQGKPAYYYLLDGKIYLYPVPQAAGTLYRTYYWRPPALVNDTDTFAVEDADRVLITYAVWQAYLEDGNPLAQVWKTEFVEELTRWATIEKSRETVAFQPQARW